MFNYLFAILIAISAARTNLPAVLPAQVAVLSSHEIAMEKRQADPWVNNVFKENILLTIAYARGTAILGQPVDWNKVNAPFSWSLDIQPGKGISFHNLIYPKYQGITTPWNEIHYYTSEGFLSDGNLIGDGVCHIASLMAWAAKDAGLAVEAPTNHDFAPIPQVPKEEGVAIYYAPNDLFVSAKQNLYIQNNKEVPVRFVFDYNGTSLQIQVEEIL